MKNCTKILMTAVMSISLGSASWAQSSAGGASGSAAPGSTASGNQNQVGGSAPAGGTGQTTPSDSSSATGAGSSGTSASDASSTAGGSSSSSAASGTDALGNQSSDTTHTMQGGGSTADAQLSAQMDKLASMPDKAADGLFVLDNAKGNMFEIAFAKLAQQKSQDSQIKDLAKMIEQDHTQANDQLKTIAQKMGLELPTSLPSDKQKMLQVLSALNTQDFDTCYLLDNKMAHAKDITSFADHQKSVKDEDLRKYITAVLPKLQQHGTMIQQAATAKGYPAPMGMGAGHGGMDHSGMGGHGTTPGGSGANTDPTAPANNQNPSNR